MNVLRGNIILTPEAKEKISKLHKGKIVSEATREKLSIANTGFQSSLDSRLKVSIYNGHRRDKDSIIKRVVLHDVKGYIIHMDNWGDNLYFLDPELTMDEKLYLTLDYFMIDNTYRIALSY